MLSDFCSPNKHLLRISAIKIITFLSHFSLNCFSGILLKLDTLNFSLDTEVLKRTFYSHLLRFASWSKIKNIFKSVKKIP